MLDINGVPILRTKLVVPQARNTIVSRQRLLDICYDVLDRRLLICSAPAGYGKTTLIIDFVHQIDLPACWYSLDVSDIDTRRFIAHFIASLQHQFPDFGEQSLSIFNNTGSNLNLDQIVATIVNETYGCIPNHFLFILDDYQFVNDNEEINYFVSQFIQQVDESCHLILTTRTLPYLPDMPLLVARGQVVGLDFETLAFNAKEIQKLIQQNHNLLLAKADAIALEEKTEGWITGLLLSAQTMAINLVERIRNSRVSGVNLHNYLTQQVFEQQPPHIQEFLLHTSLLEEFNADLCTKILGPAPYLNENTWQELIAIILENNVFIQPIDSTGQWVRYHHLFENFLQTRMLAKYPETSKSILFKLATTYTEQEDWDRAYQTHQKLGDPEALADFIEKAGPSLVRSSRNKTLARWLTTLPNEILDSRVRLLHLQGNAYLEIGQPQKALTLLNRAKEQASQLDELYLVYIFLSQAATYRYIGDYKEALNLIDEAILIIQEKKESKEYASALRQKGLTLRFLGQLNQSVYCLEQSQTIYQALDNDGKVMAVIQVELGVTYEHLGNYEQAKLYYEQALAYWKQTKNIARQPIILNNLGVLYHFLGKYEQSSKLLNEAINLSQQMNINNITALALTSLGDLYLDLDALDEALNAYNQAYQILQTIEYNSLDYHLTLKKTTIARLKCDWTQAQVLLALANKTAVSSSSPSEKGQYALEAGQLALTQEQVTAALSYFQEAICQFENSKQSVDIAIAYLMLACTYYFGDKLEYVAHNLESSFQNVADLTYRHFWIVASRKNKKMLMAMDKLKKTEPQVKNLVEYITDFENNLSYVRRQIRQHASTIPFAPPELIIQALGDTKVILGNKIITKKEWQSQVARDLLFFLLARPQGVTREEINVMFWPDDAPNKIKTNFSKTMYRLRRAFDDNKLIADSIVIFNKDENKYYFNHQLDYKYDVVIFHSYLKQADNVIDLTAKISFYQKAIDVYQGSYLPFVDRAWVLSKREFLHQTYVKVLLKLANLFIEVKEYDHAIGYCQDLLTNDPCLEEVYCLLMQIYATQKNQVEIARQYTRCWQSLKDELSIEPSSETTMLYHKLMRKT